eukprot:11471568-Alexandrium_andersonii.AAC.1
MCGDTSCLGEEVLQQLDRGRPQGPSATCLVRKPLRALPLDLPEAVLEQQHKVTPRVLEAHEGPSGHG